MLRLLKTKLHILLLVLALLFAFPQESANGLNSPNKISTGVSEALYPSIVTDSNGRVHIVWMDGEEGIHSETTNLVHSYWNGDVWSAPATIATGNYHELPSLAADTSGNVYLVWNADTNPDAWQIYYSKYNGTSWSSALAISGANPSDTAWDAKIAIDSSGNPNVAYTFIPAGVGCNCRYIYYTNYNGASWSAPVSLSQAGALDYYPAIAADSTGKVHVVWRNVGPAAINPYQIRHRVWNGSSWSSETSISNIFIENQESTPRIAVDKNNNAHVVWQEGDIRLGPLSVMYSKWSGTSWSSPFTVSSTSNQNIFGVASVTVIPSSLSDVLVGWIDKSTTPLKVDFRKYNAATDTWETERTNNINQTSADFPSAAMDKWDNVHVAWAEKNASTNKYEIFYDAIPLAVNVIGSSGGTVTTFNGDTLTIPSGSLSQNTIISAQIAPLSQTAPGGNITPPRQYVFEPTGTVFNPALTAVFKYTDAEIAGGNENTLGIYVWDSPTGSWVFKTGNINKPQNRLTVQLDHFSIYGLFATTDSVDWVSPFAANTVNEFKQGRNVPIKFKTGDPVDISQLKVQIIDTSANLIAEFLPDHGSGTLRYDEQNQQYVANFDTKDQAAGSYQVNVLYQGLLKDSTEIMLND